MIIAQTKNLADNVLTVRLNRGFTLLELMVTLAVAAIVLTVAVPSFTNLIVRNSLTGEANELISAFNLARNEAIKLNQNTRLCHSDNGVNCTAPGAAGWQGWLIADTGNRVIASGFFSANLRTTGTANTDVIQFTSNGLIRNNINGAPLGGTFTICSDSEQVPQNARLMNFVSGGRVSVDAARIEECV